MEEVSQKAASLTGFATGTKLVSGGGDQQCTGIGTGAIKKGIVEVTVGTAAVTMAYMDGPYYDDRMCLHCSDNVVAGKWETEWLQNAAGSSLKWYRNEFAIPEMELSEETGIDPYDYINEQVADIKPGAYGLICIPYFASSVVPNWDPFARGTFIGLTLWHQRPTLARAIMEGVTFETREIVEQMAANGVEIDTIIISGGASKSAVWNQIQADIYGKPVLIPAIEEATSLGAAILAAVGEGLYDSVEAAVDQMVQIAGSYEPDMAIHDRYNRYFTVYKDAYRALADAGVYERLVKLAL
ncbi:FGGY-family carbohydrate kinase [Eubacterium aggregans]|uniref:FGGY-family carbohydrate kinase n=1 Tax=Eubacterium aggregans TaxID=81409 RepID=UPI003F3FBB3A